jgi:hypothetical protein
VRQAPPRVPKKEKYQTKPFCAVTQTNQSLMPIRNEPMPAPVRPGPHRQIQLAAATSPAAPRRYQNNMASLCRKPRPALGENRGRIS